MYDLIGDLHGHADALIALLVKLGYQRQDGVPRHPQRQVIFLGDFIDRGPKIRELLEIVRPMVESGAALAVMGNHEFNALAYHTPDPHARGAFLRSHDKPNNVRQHEQTMLQLSPTELQSHLAWFRTLPLWLDFDGLRVVHACWDDNAVQQIGRLQNGPPIIDDSFMIAASRSGDPLYRAVETLLKGPEVKLPPGVSFVDKDGHHRFETRIRWYLPAAGHTYRSYAFTNDVSCDLPLAADLLQTARGYPAGAKPVFVGHYWLPANKPPRLLADNVACLDFSVAKGGFLCAYRWDGEAKLQSSNFCWV